MMFYPLSGFIADVCCGRLKTVTISLCLLLICVCLICFTDVIVFLAKLNSLSYYDYSSFLHSKLIFQFVFILAFVLAPFLLLLGLAGYQVNFIQLGLDQLLDALSQYLGLFIHYATWAFHLGSLLLTIIILLFLCAYYPLSRTETTAKAVILLLPFITALFLMTLLLISRWKHNWFYAEPGQHNPSKTDFTVIRFAKKNMYPLQRSAFTYNDDYIPSRIDFAKERFGRPFTTKQVENVKTFLDSACFTCNGAGVHIRSTSFILCLSIV